MVHILCARQSAWLGVRGLGTRPGLRSLESDSLLEEAAKEFSHLSDEQCDGRGQRGCGKSGEPLNSPGGQQASWKEYHPKEN